MERMKELVEILNEAGEAYYRDSRERMSNQEYDALYDELVALEEATGIVLSNSPTVKVGGEVLDFLPKEAHEVAMLSLNKTKELDELKSFLGNREGMVSWKLDGLTVVLTYQDGELWKAVTRGNGEVGEVITNNAKMFRNLPLKIPFRGKVVLRGEAVIGYSDFQAINRTITEIALKYKNPRNLCSGSVRQLNPEITRKRRVGFYGFGLVLAQGLGFSTRMEQLAWLEQQGFSVVEHRLTGKDSIEKDVEYFASQVERVDLPSDGLVVTLNDLAYGATLGATSKFPRDAMAYKWRDEMAETILTDVEWNASRTGLINPIAIFQPVELEGTTVSRASVHNVSMVKELKLGIGDRILVYKANMIIPQISANLTGSDSVEPPDHCPACGIATQRKREREVEVLLCPNSHCPAKEIKSYALLVSRNALNVDGLSEATLEKWIGAGLIHQPADLFRLGGNPQAREKIIAMEGFGEKSFRNLLESLEISRKTTASRLLYGLGVPNIGTANAKAIAAFTKDDFSRMMNLSREELLEISGVGDVLADGYVNYFRDVDRRKMVEGLLAELKIAARKDEGPQVLEGKTYVITGSTRVFENRDALKAFLEGKGGKVTGSVSAKTDALINNEKASSSTKNKAAKSMGIPIITEEELLEFIEKEEVSGGEEDSSRDSTESVAEGETQQSFL